MKEKLIIYVIFISGIVLLRPFLLDYGFFNMPFLITTGISPLVLWKYYNKINSIDILLITTWILMLIFSLFHYSSFKYLTIFYTLFFITSFLSFYRGIKYQIITFQEFIYIIKCIIIAYWAVLVIQELCVIFGIPIFNLINTNVEGFKLNSLAIEPSNTARYVYLLMLGYLFLRELETNKKYSWEMFKQDFFIWFCFLYMMIFMGSVSAIMFIPFLFLRFLSIKNFALLTVFIFLLFGIASQYDEYLVVRRALRTFNAVLTFDEYNIIRTEGSGSIRIVPIIYYIKNIDISSLNFWFGYGMDGNYLFFKDVIDYSGLPEGIGYGAFMATVVNFGFIPTVLIFIFMIKYCIYDKRYIDFITIFFLIILPSGYNTNIAWAAFMIMYANKYFSNKLKYAG